MKNKIIYLAFLAIPLGVSAETYVVRVPQKVEIGKWTENTRLSQWEDSGEVFSCSTYLPEDDINSESILQSSECSIKQKAIKTTYGTHSLTNSEKITSQEEVERVVPVTLYRLVLNSEWSESGAPYNCSTWTPSPIEVSYGTQFQQSSSCLQAISGTKATYRSNEQGQKLELLSVNPISKVASKNITQYSKGTYLARNMCYDILARGESRGNGIYSVDPDGTNGAYAPRNAYCDMSGGGWTLFDNFGTRLHQTGSSVTAYNHSAINSPAALSQAGYGYSLNVFNTAEYHINANYAQMFYSNNTSGYITKAMPSYVRATRVALTTAWFGGSVTVNYGGNVATGSYSDIKYLSWSGASTLRITENATSIMWVDSVWVR